MPAGHWSSAGTLDICRHAHQRCRRCVDLLELEGEPDAKVSAQMVNATHKEMMDTPSRRLLQNLAFYQKLFLLAAVYYIDRRGGEYIPFSDLLTDLAVLCDRCERAQIPRRAVWKISCSLAAAGWLILEETSSVRSSDPDQRIKLRGPGEEILTDFSDDPTLAAVIS